MLIKRIIHFILIFTLVLQLFPTNRAGRFLMLDLPEDEYGDVLGSKSMRQLVEEEHKEIHIGHEWIIIPVTFVNKAIFHFAESLPTPHPGAIPTPPPNMIFS